jgi:eukaryotic-like serine/threonine-protein kinase
MRQVGNGRYSLVRELGRGGMGAVWLAQDTMLGRDVAVKELMVPGGVPHDERAVYQERVLREARIASRLTDPAVVTVYDLIKEDDQTYIVMELIKAPTLTELVQQNGPLAATAAAKLAEQLLSALEAAHESGVVHRDVKPGNVMVPAKGTAKLTDFGIAQSLDDPRLTLTGVLIGSPAYMSPERLSGGAASPAWDLWALGATLFFAVEGRGAFERATTSATMLAVMTERADLRLCRGPLAELIMGLLEPNPEARIRVPRARQLIEQALSGRRPAEPATVQTAPVPQPPPFQYEYRVRPKRRYGNVIATVVVAGLVVAGVILYPKFFPGVSSGSQDPTRQSAGPSKAMQPVLTFGPDGDIKNDSGLMAFGSDCLTWTPAKGGPVIKSANRVGCYGPHDVETLDTIAANFEMEKDVPYPSLEELTRNGTSGCTETFRSAKVTGQNKDDTLRFWVVVPTAEAWKVKTSNGYRSSSRVIYCFVGKADGSKLTEPVMAPR